NDNFSNPTNRLLVAKNFEEFLIKETNRLHVKGRFIHIGDENIDNTKHLSDRLGYEFYHANNGNASTFTQSYIQATTTTTRFTTDTSLVARTTTPRPVNIKQNISILDLIASSPEVPSTYIELTDRSRLITD
ncbi:unnamed protein product, partial [Didymodactylos carnosus]